MILDEGKCRVLFYPKISLVKSDDEELSLKQGEWSYGQEIFSLFFKVGGGLEDRMIFEVFLFMISWEEK